MKKIKAIVTGSTSGIGKEITSLLLKSGASVIGLARDHKKFEPDLRSRISSCQSDPAWINPSSNRYKKCTKEIGFSSGLKLEDLDIVENFVAHNIIFEIPSDVQIGQLMEGLHPLESKGIQKAMQYINQSSYSYKNKHSCGKK